MSGGYIRAKEKLETLSEEETDISSRRSRRGFSEAQVQNTKAARVYVFGQNDIYDSGDADIEMSEIRSRKANRTNILPSTNSSGNSVESENIFFERQISEDDTLASLALQYGCPVSELKRINKLISDQDFFALKSVKVPIKRYGYISELLEQQKLEGAAASAIGASSVPKGRSRHGANGAASSEPELPEYRYEANDIAEESDNYLSDPEMQNLLIRTLSIRDNMRTQSKEAEDFLNSMDKDLQQIRKSTNSYKPSLRDVTYTLTDKRIQPLKKGSRWTDCNMTWRQIVLIALVVGIALPLLGICSYCLKYECHFIS